jgi:hypothetical protein
MMKRVSLGTLVVLVICASRIASADIGYAPEVRLTPPPEGFAWNFWSGEYRFSYSDVGNFVLDETGTRSPVQGYGEHRVRLAPALAWKFVGIKVELDLLEGQLFGDGEDFFPDSRRLDRRVGTPGTGFDHFLLREAYLQVATPVGLFRAGQMTSQYGLGIIGNAGRDDDERFGIRRYGDIVDRFLILLKPFRPLTGPGAWGDYFTIMGSGDLVFRDENAVWQDGDRAYQGNSGLFWMHPEYTNGVVFTYRNQEDDDGDSLRAYVVNVNGHNRFVFSTMPARDVEDEDGIEPDLSCSFDYEMVWLMGHTDRMQQLGSEDGLDLQSFGAVGRVGFDVASIGLETEVEIGYASGDHNSYDDESHAFFFDPDYNVGLIFFEEMWPLISARAAEISSDPGNLAVPPKGLDLVPSQGRATNTFYLLPNLRWTWNPSFPVLRKVQLLAGGLVLFSPAGPAHSYYTFRNGGTAANHLGGAVESSYLGTEFLAGLRIEVWPWKEHLGLAFKVDESYFLPGKALAAPGGSIPDGVWKIMASAALMWR